MKTIIKFYANNEPIIQVFTGLVAGMLGVLGIVIALTNEYEMTLRLFGLGMITLGTVLAFTLGYLSEEATTYRININREFDVIARKAKAYKDNRP